jgi:ERCC4-type nuclease
MSRSERDARAVVVVDTREQLPYELNPELVHVVRRALIAGDYALDGLENRLVIERKSLDDYVFSVVRARERFLRELELLATCSMPYVVVEGSLDAVVDHRYRAGVHPNAVLGATWAIIVDYGVPVFFADDRQLACRFVEGLLLRAHHKGLVAAKAAHGAVQARATASATVPSAGMHRRATGTSTTEPREA